MKYFMFLVLLPCILAAETEKSTCADGVLCPQGKYCCQLPNGKHGCCDLAKDIENKGYVPAIHPAFVPTNVSMAVPNAMDMFCPGTVCGDYCVLESKNAVCCDKPGAACPPSTVCCGFSRPWCCGGGSSCSSTQDTCLSNEVCPGTTCGLHCFKERNAVCCSKAGHACPSGAKCCGYSDPWCCLASSICGSRQNSCLNSSVTTSAAMISVLLAFIMGIFSKYFL